MSNRTVARAAIRVGHVSQELPIMQRSSSIRDETHKHQWRFYGLAGRNMKIGHKEIKYGHAE